MASVRSVVPRECRPAFLLEPRGGASHLVVMMGPRDSLSRFANERKHRRETRLDVQLDAVLILDGPVVRTRNVESQTTLEQQRVVDRRNLVRCPGLAS